MFAVVETSGKQYRVEPGAIITVDRMPVAEGETVTLNNVLLIGGADLKIGAPTVQGASVTAKVVGHPKGEKVMTFKYTPTHRTRRRVGFRHSHTTLEIVSIDG
jgi:large subunit ribosomal protein L21